MVLDRHASTGAMMGFIYLCAGWLCYHWISPFIRLPGYKYKHVARRTPRDYYVRTLVRALRACVFANYRELKTNIDTKFKPKSDALLGDIFLLEQRDMRIARSPSLRNQKNTATDDDRYFR